MASIRYGRFILALILSAPLGLIFLLSGSNLIFLLVRNFFDIRPVYTVDTGIFVGSLISGGLCFICYFVVTKLYLWVRVDKSTTLIFSDDEL
jgi:hypothetical protein